MPLGSVISRNPFIVQDRENNPEPPPRQDENNDFARKIIGELGTCVHEWKIKSLWKNGHLVLSEKTVSLFRNPNDNQNLQLVLTDNKTQDQNFGEFPVTEHMSIDEQIDSLSSQDVLNLNDDVPLFGQSYTQIKMDNIGMKLLNCDEQLMWLLQWKNGKNVLMNVKAGTNLVDLKDQPEKIQQLYSKHVTDRTPEITDQDCISFFSDFEITKITNQPNTELWKVHIEPFSETSYIDPTLRVTKDIWNVCMIAYKSKCGGNNHASICVEKLNKDGKYVMKKADFNPPVELKTFDPTKLKYKERTQVWQISSDRVQKMLEVIKKEKDNPEESPTFSLCSEASMFCRKGTRNCTTWALEKLKMLCIESDRSPFTFIAVGARFYTHGERYFQKQINKRIIKKSLADK